MRYGYEQQADRLRSPLSLILSTDKTSLKDPFKIATAPLLGGSLLATTPINEDGLRVRGMIDTRDERKEEEEMCNEQRVFCPLSTG